MKPTTLIIFSVLIFISLSSATNTAVVDVDGKKLDPRFSYYILPLIRGNGGGLTLSSRNKSTSCPLTVAQEKLEVSRGLPVKFYPVDPKGQSTVELSTDFNAEFQIRSRGYTKKVVWRLGDFDEGTKHWYVVSGGKKGNPGRETVGNWFKIEKEGDIGYKLVHCPSVCDFCKVICGDLGIFREDEKRWLGINNEKPLRVVFKKAY